MHRGCWEYNAVRRGNDGPNGAGCGGPASGIPASGMGWGGPAKGAHPPKPRNLPGAHVVVDPDDMSLAERETELRARSEVWRAKRRAFDLALEARRTRKCAYRAALIWGAARRS